MRADKRDWDVRYFHTISTRIPLLLLSLHHIRPGNRLNRFHSVSHYLLLLLTTKLKHCRYDFILSFEKLRPPLLQARYSILLLMY